MLAHEQKKKLETILSKNWGSHTDAESNIVMVFTATAFLNGDFDILFESGFHPEGLAESFEAIGHRMAAYTVRLAYRVYRHNAEDPALKLLADAVGLMEDSINTLLGEYVESTTASDSQPRFPVP